MIKPLFVVFSWVGPVGRVVEAILVVKLPQFVQWSEHIGKLKETDPTMYKTFSNL